MLPAVCDDPHTTRRHAGRDGEPAGGYAWVRTRLKADDFICVVTDDDADIDRGWEALFEQILAQNSTGRLMADRYNAIDESVLDQLPDETKALLRRWREHDEERENVRTNAVFLFGVALGRRLGGAQ